MNKLLEVPFIHNGILTVATLICDYTGAVGHRFRYCKDFVHQFGEPMFDAIEGYILTKDRICNEHFGFCKSPIITSLDLDTVVNNILATKPVAV